jgi:hypothetical protein
MATSEYPYSECTGPAQIYKKVVSVSTLHWSTYMHYLTIYVGTVHTTDLRTCIT